MTPEELAFKHPRLYHITSPNSWPLIKLLGLCSAQSLMQQLEPQKSYLLKQRRSDSIVIHHTDLGQAVLTDQRPLSVKALTRCLDNELAPQDWLTELNRRVFFWADRSGAERLLKAKTNRHRARNVLIFDTYRLACDYAEYIQLSAINTGSTIRKPARRGLATYTPMLKHSYAEWRKLRGGNDKILEVTLTCTLHKPDRYLVNTEHHPGCCH